MSKVALSGNASGTGTFTLASPNSNSDRTLNLPDASGTVQVSGNPISGTTGTFSGNLTLGSSVLATPTGTAPSYLCRAWVNFSGIGTVAIRASGNVSSITDVGTGDYRMNFVTAMPDANYAGVGSTQGSGVSVLPVISVNQDNDQTTTYVDIYTTGGSTATPADFTYVAVAIFR